MFSLSFHLIPCFVFKASNGQNGGVIRTEGEPWKVMRRWGLQSMRNLGVGRTGLERQFISDISKLIGKLQKEIQEKGDGEEIAQMDLQKHIDRLIGSIINRVLFGYAFDEVGIELELEGTSQKYRDWLNFFPGEYWRIL
jgi:hypothetical protein